MRVAGAALLLGALTSCSNAPTTVLLEIQAEPGLAAPEELRLSVYDGVVSGPAVASRRLPELGPPGLPSSVVLYPRAGSTLLRIQVRAQRASALLGEGAALVSPISGQQIHATVVIRSGALPDQDGDGVPDAIDSCPTKANPDQTQICAAADARPDRPVDGPTVDGVPDSPRSDAILDQPGTIDLPIPKDTKADKPRLDTPKTDTKPKLDTTKLDTRKTDTKPSDTRPPDLRPPDTSPLPPWLYRRAITITSTGNTALTSYQVVVLLPAGFDYGKTKAGGADLRFSTSSSPYVPSNLSHWIESWTSTGSKIWVRIPSIPGPGTVTITMFYGNPSAASTSNLSAVFPGRFVSSASLSLGGNHTYDWFELQAAHTLTLSTAQPLTITARRILISGTVDGKAAGYPGGATGITPGSGPGGGQSVSGSGAGGGGYGGVGGAGGYDSTGPIAAGGLANGSPTDGAIAMGSGGGATNAGVGGAGGGALTLVARDLLVSGAITLAGGVGLNGSQSSGGGAGGGLLVRGYQVVLGSVNLSGGAGGIATSASNDGGGGGGGGRLKVFHEASHSPATFSVAGGAGGAGGDTAPGQNGAIGSSHAASASVEVTSTSVGPEIVL